MKRVNVGLSVSIHANNLVPIGQVWTTEGVAPYVTLTFGEDEQAVNLYIDQDTLHKWFDLFTTLIQEVETKRNHGNDNRLAEPQEVETDNRQTDPETENKADWYRKDETDGDGEATGKDDGQGSIQESGERDDGRGLVEKRPVQDLVGAHGTEKLGQREDDSGGADGDQDNAETPAL